MHVMAAILKDVRGQVLLAQRPPGKHLAGQWEFAGGKLEPGEGRLQGLVREIEEELGVTVKSARPWMWLPWRYGERSLQLDVWMVDAWQGLPHGREGQAIAWHDPASVDPGLMAGADRMVLRSLQLPSRYLITAAESRREDRPRVERQLRKWLADGQCLIQLRLPLWSMAEVRDLAAELLPAVRSVGACLLLNADVEGARMLGAGTGVQLRSSQLAQWSQRPLPWGQRVGASCHDVDELAAAVALDADFATLSPVRATASHPGVPGMGWERFAEQVTAAAVPVYALGGVGPDDDARAAEAGAQGVAGIRAFADGYQPSTA